MSNQSGAALPPWLREDHLEEAPLNSPTNPVLNSAPTSATPVPNTTPKTPEQEKRATTIHWALRIITMVLCVLMCATAVIGVENINEVDASGKIFVAFYMFLFSALLFTFEMMGIKRVEAIEYFYKRNFGFLYNILGKALFIIFIAFLSFGLGDPQALTYGTGCVVALFGFVEVGLYLKYPEVFE